MPPHSQSFLHQRDNHARRPRRVADAPLTATGRAVTGTAGVAFNGVVASYTDSDPNGKATDYRAIISWGDGQSSGGTISPTSQGGFDVSGNGRGLWETVSSEPTEHGRGGRLKGFPAESPRF